MSPATACQSQADEQTAVDASASQVTLAQANIKGSLPAAAHTADLATVVAPRPDFVTLNETYFRTDAQLRPDGYSSYRADAPFDARETPVLWRTDAWQLLDSGTELMHDRAVKWGTRYANWVTLTSTQGETTVSLVSVHASPGGPGRDGLLREYVTRLDALIASLRATGPVLVGGDLNTPYPTSGFLRDWLDGSGATSTFDALGEPTGGWATGDGGGTIDYILTAGHVQPISQATADLAHSDHRLLTATLKFSDADPGSGSTNCPTPPSEQPTDLPDGFAGALIAATASQLGLPYVWGGGNFDGPTGGGFDCSGLVLFAAYQASGGQIRLPHYSGDQIRAGQAIAWEQKQPGDLIFFTYPEATVPHHVAVFVGGDQLLHAPHTGDVVRYGTIGEFAGQRMTIRRLL
ncbi:NlpC/P60 family protein [Nocardioides palaemonis]|uniref:NlpC/P60 family protein n=1 Tax=Nocardioides palaemonis TaxID=2829810 RepID=UPI0027DD0FD1|nr:NlpC/P60 family protein [Nocardioides palaemonis]